MSGRRWTPTLTSLAPPSNGVAPVVGPASAGRGGARGNPPPEGGPTSNGGASVVGPASAGRGNAHGRPPPEGGPTSNGGAPVVGPASAGRGGARGRPPPEGGPTRGAAMHAVTRRLKAALQGDAAACAVTRRLKAALQGGAERSSGGRTGIRARRPSRCVPTVARGRFAAATRPAWRVRRRQGRAQGASRASPPGLSACAAARRRRR